MVCAQYTGVSLQKDDRAFTKFNEETAQFESSWNGVAVTDPEELSTGSFATTPYHTDGRAYFKNEWRNAHVRLSNDAFIQAVSIFAVGFADHFRLSLVLTSLSPTLTLTSVTPLWMLSDTRDSPSSKISTVSLLISFLPRRLTSTTPHNLRTMVLTSWHRKNPLVLLVSTWQVNLKRLLILIALRLTSCRL